MTGVLPTRAPSAREQPAAPPAGGRADGRRRASPAARAALQRAGLTPHDVPGEHSRLVHVRDALNAVAAAPADARAATTAPSTAGEVVTVVTTLPIDGWDEAAAQRLSRAITDAFVSVVRESGDVDIHDLTGLALDDASAPLGAASVAVVLTGPHLLPVARRHDAQTVLLVEESVRLRIACPATVLDLAGLARVVDGLATSNGAAR